MTVERIAVGSLPVEVPPVRLSYLLVKRAIDVVVSIALIVVLAPFLLIVSLVILVDAGWPILFVQERVGARMRSVGRGRFAYEIRHFRILKFRTMRTGEDPALHSEFIRAFVRGDWVPDAGDPMGFKLNDDPRVTRTGRWLRATSLDELPQLVNVLTGTMSLVGPRPVPPYEVEGYEQHHMRRLAALPGITGTWQVHGRGRTTFEQMVLMDVEYVDRRSILLDARLLAQTIPCVLLRRGAR